MQESCWKVKAPNKNFEDEDGGGEEANRVEREERKKASLEVVQLL